jgi:hypothetical protein
MEMAVKSMEMAVESMEMAVESMEMMEMALGVIPCPGRVPEKRLLSPKLVFDGGSAAELYLGKC